MKVIHALFIVLLSLTACSQPKIDKYNSIIDRTTRIEITFKDSARKVEFDKKQVEIFKDILKRNIEPEIQRKFIADAQIDLYEKDGRIGFLMITDNETKPFVNFGSDNLNFGFHLTYGIGMYLNENK